MHGLMPYFMLRGILKISNPVAMVRSVLDLFLARPFGSTSLLQKMFSSGLNDEVRDLKEDAEMVARKIGDDRLCDKIRQFVEMDKEGQDELRADAGERLSKKLLFFISAETHSRFNSCRKSRYHVGYPTIFFGTSTRCSNDATTRSMCCRLRRVQVRTRSTFGS